jgi:hypothetical protein
MWRTDLIAIVTIVGADFDPSHTTGLSRQPVYAKILLRSR